MAKVAITGSTGFVGGNIAEALQQLEFEVVGLARNAAELPWEVRVVDFKDTKLKTEYTKLANKCDHDGEHELLQKLGYEQVDYYIILKFNQREVGK